MTWKSSDTTWATINSSGLATAVSPGPVTISATVDGITGSTGLTVTAATLVSIAVTPANTSLATGNTEQFTATGTLSDKLDGDPDFGGDLEVVGHDVGDDQQQRAGDGGESGTGDDLSGGRRDHGVDGTDRDRGDAGFDCGDAIEHEPCGGQD